MGIWTGVGVWGGGGGGGEEGEGGAIKRCRARPQFPQAQMPSSKEPLSAAKTLLRICLKHRGLHLSQTTIRISSKNNLQMDMKGFSFKCEWVGYVGQGANFLNTQFMGLNVRVNNNLSFLYEMNCGLKVSFPKIANFYYCPVLLSSLPCEGLLGVGGSSCCYEPI